MRIVFLGTPEFAVPSLTALVNAGHEIPAVLTQPDRPKGRGGALAQSPVKQTALTFAIPVLQPERVRRPENVELLRRFEADLMVVVGYGQIIPQTIIDMPRFGIVNVHASLLPKYRGAAPIQWAIANGERTTGVTIMQIDAGLDTGDVLMKAETAIGEHEAAPELSARLALLGAELLLQAIPKIADGSIRREKQKDAEATLAPILRKEDGQVDWTQRAQVIDARLRGFTPWPGANTNFRGQQLSILKAMVGSATGLAKSGALHRENRDLLVSCGGGTTLKVLELQPSGKKRMTADAFLNGYRVVEGERLGEAV